MLRLRVLFLFLSIVLAHTVTAALPKELLNKSYTEVRESLDSLYRITGKARVARSKAIVSKWMLEAQNAGATTLANQLKLIVITRLTAYYDEKYSQSSISEIQQIIDYADKSGLQYMEVDGWVAMGNYYRSYNQFSKSLEAYYKSYIIYKDFSVEEFPYLLNHLFNLSLAYYRFEDYVNSIKYLKELLTLGPINKYTNIKTVYNTIGLAFRHTEQYDSAEVYFKRIIDSAQADGDDTWLGIASGNLGITYFYTKKYDEAIPLLELDTKQSIIDKSFVGAAKSNMIRSEIHFLRNEFEEARQKVLHSRTLLDQAPHFNSSGKYEIYEGIFTLLSKLDYQDQAYKSAYAYIDSALMYKDSMERVFNMTSLARTQHDIDKLEQELVEEGFLHERAIYLLIRNVLIGGVVLLLVIGLLLINSQRLKERALQAELNNASNRLNDFTRNIHEKNTLIDQLSQGGKKEAHLHEPLDEETETILELRKAILLTDEQWDEFKVLFEKVHKGFFRKLHKAYPDLTPSETRFLTLTKLQLAPKQIASMLGTSDNAIRLYRHRLKKKLGLTEEQSVETLVESLS